MLVAALAAQLAGCAKTTQWVRHAVGRDGAESAAVAEGRGKSSEKDKSKGKDKEQDQNEVKVASAKDAQREKKKAKKTEVTADHEETLAAKTKSKQAADDKLARTLKSRVSPRDPFEEDALESQITDKSRTELASAKGSFPKRSTSTNLLEEDEALVDVAGSRRKLLADEEASEVREVSHLERRKVADADWARDSGTIAETSTKTREIPEEESPIEKTSVSKKLAALKPSRANSLQLCPQAEGEVRELVGELEADDLDQLTQGIHRLGKLGPDAAAALPALEQLLQHANGHVRVHAALAVCRIDSVSPAALETLTTELKSDDPAVRSFAAAVIAELGPQSGDAMPALVEAMHDPDAYVRLHVAEVLIRYEDHSAEALDVLLKCLEHKDENLRWLAAYSLAELAPQSEEAVHALVESLGDSSPKVQIGVVYALGEIGGLSQAAAAELRKLDRNANPEMRSAVAYALEQIESSEDTDE